jgi:hypothetical protein
MNSEEKPTPDQMREYNLQKMASSVWLVIGLVITVVIFCCGHFKSGCVALFITVTLFLICMAAASDEIDMDKDGGDFPPDSGW